MASTPGDGGPTPVAPPRPGVLASLTDHHVLVALRDAAGPISRAEVAAATGLSKPAVSTSAARLLERGLVHEVGVRTGRRGGVATLVQINASRGHSLALSVQPEALEVEARALDGAVLATATTPLGPGVGRAAVVEGLRTAVVEVEAAAGSPLLATAVSLAGPVDARTGVLLDLEREAFRAGHLDPREVLPPEATDCLVVDNDVNWAAVHEHRAGAARGVDDVVYVYVGAGIGAALLLGGRLYRGRGGLGGEIGYLRSTRSLDLTQALGHCGIGRPDQYGLDLAAVERLLAAPELTEQARAVVDLVVTAVVNLAVTLNPSALLVAGPWTHHEVLLAELGGALERFCLDPPEVAAAPFSPLGGAGAEAHRLACERIGLPAAAALA